MMITKWLLQMLVRTLSLDCTAGCAAAHLASQHWMGPAGVQSRANTVYLLQMHL